MKKAVPALLSVALIVASTSAMAEGESVDLTVTGSVVPSACVPTLDSEELDWGKIQSSALHEALPLLLETKDLKLTVACAAPTKFGVQIIDNKADSALPGTDPGYRGLGFVGDAKFPIGAYSVRSNDSTADGSPAGNLLSVDKGLTWTHSTGPLGLAIESTDWVGLTTAQAAPWAPTAATNAVLNFKVQALISSRNQLPPIGEGDIALDGSSTFEIKYL
ncbi:DUF1120 domain-containing protein [Pseudoxanthomonas sp. UTMC 1351]|uniref:DUF1120 domain-containing protein n=1 Tax=Pseudoxanthomonas sp. UTMC 1351 TaxID=2695853 RepID=UPI0034CF1DDE